MRESFNVVALISGGKDSFFSILHCVANGHRIVALANLHPPSGHGRDGVGTDDLDSHMYQTVGHDIIPLYEHALGIPLYRLGIEGTAVNRDISYRPQSLGDGSDSHSDDDETESLTQLLRAVMSAIPEANAVSTGAILSNYQRTRIESVSLRLGLTPISYLWQYPYLPPGTSSSLLDDMADVRQDARLIKVASGGLDETFLWECVSSERGKLRLLRAMRRYGGEEHGAILGEGGEYETLVVDGPAPLWKYKIHIEEHNREVVHQGSGSALLRIKNPKLVSKLTDSNDTHHGWQNQVRIPPLLSTQFMRLCHAKETAFYSSSDKTKSTSLRKMDQGLLGDWNVSQGKSVVFVTNMIAPGAGDSIKDQMSAISKKLRQTLGDIPNCSIDDIVFATVYLRSMDSFLLVNQEYKQLFPNPDPPARVTICVGDVLPDGVKLCLNVTIDRGPRNARVGLHVQSRSYWAPANIGPYSQAISVPIRGHDSDESTGGSLVYLAGQIPLVPASMSLCSLSDVPSEVGALSQFEFQAILSLQHLWRIGQATNTSWFARGIAFITSSKHNAERAAIAWKYWHQLHREGEQEAPEEEDDEVIDIWDRSCGRAQQQASEDLDTSHRIPNSEYVTIESQRDMIAPFMAIEVDTLPRGCDIEWAAIGSAGNKISVQHASQPGWSTYSCRLAGPGAVLLHALVHDDCTDEVVVSKILGCRDLDGIHWGLKLAEAFKNTSLVHVTVYTARRLPELVYREVNIIPCRSIWGEGGQKMAAGILVQGEQR